MEWSNSTKKKANNFGRVLRSDYNGDDRISEIGFIVSYYGTMIPDKVMKALER